MGVEGAGTVEAVGPGVSEVKEGDRAAWALSPGSYATHALVPAARLVVLPPGLDFRSAAAAMLQGTTAYHLTHDTYPLKAGETCLVHAAAGGVGLLLCQMAKMRGARVIGTVSSDAKAKAAMDAGADHVVVYTREDFEAEVKRLTNGKGVNVVYDSLGEATFEKGLNSLARRGHMVLYGEATGLVPPIQDVRVLQARGSLFLTRTSVDDYLATREELVERAGQVLRAIDRGYLAHFPFISGYGVMAKYSSGVHVQN